MSGKKEPLKKKTGKTVEEVALHQVKRVPVTYYAFLSQNQRPILRPERPAKVV